MANVLIAGFGNIGLRHFESIINYKKINKIYLYDKNFTKLVNFKKNYKKSSKVIILKSLKKSDKKFDISILSTSSNVRFSLFKKLVNNFKTKYFIFEKIVFHDPKEYDLAKEIIEKKNLKCWINCPRRTWLIYKNLKKKILSKYKLSVVVKGSNWGLLSNSIHFVDLFMFLTEKKDITFHLNKLSEKFYRSKRKNYFETDGEIMIKSNFGDRLLLIDKKNNNKNNLVFKLKQNDFNFYFDQNNNKNKFKVPLQSSETIKHVKNLINNSKCNLPSFVDTYKFHKLYSENLKKFIKKISKKNKYLFT